MTAPASDERVPCGSCGGEVGPDRYCLRCGLLAPRPRDHFTERPAAWVAGVCDRGLRKAHNEDAMALLASEEPGERAVIVVLDGVSHADDSAEAALAGAEAAREVLRASPTRGNTDAARLLTEATAAANAAIVARADPGSANPASATFVAVVLEGSRIIHANVGDSRAYWLPDAGEPQQLTADDTLARARMDAGTSRDVAEASPQAHAITKWLGGDSEDPTPRVDSVDVTGPGWLVVCSDGLWNHASAPQALRRQVIAAEAGTPAELADALLRFALDAGGHDNITVGLARVGAIRDNGSSSAEAGGAIDG